MATVSKQRARLLAVLILMVGAVLAAASVALSETDGASAPAGEADAKRAACAQLLRDYALARYSGDVETAKALVHHDVARRMLARQYWGGVSPDWVRCYTHDQIAFYGTEYSQVRRMEPESGRADAVIFDVAGFSASGMVVMEDVIELAHLVEFNGAWQIIDSAVVYMGGDGAGMPEPASDEERAKIERVCRDYCVGFYETDGRKVQDTCHPVLSKRTREQTPGTDFDWLRVITWDEIWILGRTFNERMGFDIETARCDIEIFYADENHAAAKLTGASWFDYFQLMKVNDEWKIVNVFFEGLPEAEWSPRG